MTGKRHINIRFFACLGFLLMISAMPVVIGCTSKKPVSYQELDMAVVWGDFPRTVAVLPFENHTDTEHIEQIVRESFYSHFSVRPYEDIELHMVDSRLEEARITDHIALSSIPIKDLRRILDCDAVIFGRVIRFSRLYVGIYSQMTVGAAIEMWDARTGRMLWSDEYTSRNHEGGIPTNIVDLPLLSVRSGLNLRSTVKIQAVDNLARKLSRRIPAPENMPPETSVADMDKKLQNDEPPTEQAMESAPPALPQSYDSAELREQENGKRPTVLKETDITPVANKPEPAPITHKPITQRIRDNATLSMKPGPHFEIQAAAFMERQRAVVFSNRLKQSGYPAAVRENTDTRGTWYRVYIGPYADNDGAVGVRDRIRMDFGTNAFVVDRP